MQPGWVRVLFAAVLLLSTVSCRLTGLVATPRLTDTPPLATLSSPASEQRVLTTRELREESEEPSYISTMAYPYLLLNGVDEDNGFNRAVQSILDRRSQTFKEAVGGAPIVTDDPLMPNLNSLNMDYRLYYSADDLISVHFTVSEYHAGAAHPNGMSEVLNYSLARDQVIALEDVFQPDSGYLTAISDYCIEHLKEDVFFQFEDGAQPLPENYRNWNIVPEGILVTFDPYQVAPYAAGFIKVIVPFTVLRPYLADDGLLTP